jgi:hypothetical protein
LYHDTYATSTHTVCVCHGGGALRNLRGDL